MFEKLDIPDKTSEAQTFIELYALWCEAAGKDTAIDRMRFHKLEGKLDALWSLLPQDQRNLVAELLVQQGHLPQEVREVLRLWKGRVTTVKGPSWNTSTSQS